MTHKGKRANITPNAEAIIMARALEHSRTKRTTLAEKIQAEFEGLGYDLPEIEVLERKISWYRNHDADNPQDKPWSTATLDQHSIPPEALATVLKVWKSRIEKGEGFTIREAKWTARLSGLTTDMEALSAKTSRHARTELMYELIGQSFDSTHLDRLLMGLPVTLTTPRSLLPFLAEQEDGLDQIRELGKGKSKKLHIHRTGTAGVVELHKEKEGGTP